MIISLSSSSLSSSDEEEEERMFTMEMEAHKEEFDAMDVDSSGTLDSVRNKKRDVSPDSK